MNRQGMVAGSGRTICPHCHGAGYLPEVVPLDQLRAACRANGYPISWDNRVREDAAATLLGIEAKTLRNWRYALDPRTPAFVKRNGRAMYELAAIAAALG
ncbi:hypothetical protein LVY65_05070 [Sphingomonas sp. G124]|uniref:Uncharacterized protein n=1 Tax=Sphingomonas cremea TaxID=2904799 RepID=A0A9X1QLQ3_9SPHN|nr:hypothetical protein [Sphingomonas cremea]MCF2514437.1 hypothetical protein [Sphingomonas cremea]